MKSAWESTGCVCVHTYRKMGAAIMKREGRRRKGPSSLVIMQKMAGCSYYSTEMPRLRSLGIEETNL